MGYPRSRRRRCPPLHRWNKKHYVLAALLTFISSFTAFLITFYINSDHIAELITYLFLSEPITRFESQPLPSDTILNYQARDFSGKSKSVNYDYYITYNDFNYLKPETLTYKSETYSNDIEILFRLPKKTPVLALLLIFHSCKHSAYEWFHTVERQRIIGAAIDLGYACLVFQATNKSSQCWSNNADIYENKDIEMVFKGLEGFYKTHHELVPLPRFTFGSSSGGLFSSIFAINQLYPIQGQIIQISIILPEILYTYVKAKNYPPTAWIHMLRDIEFASEQRINVSKRIFIEHQIPHNAFPIEPIYLKHTTFNDRIPSVSGETSRFLFYRLQQNHWLNLHSFLMYNPRRKLAWQSFLFPTTNPHAKGEEMFINLNKNKNTISDFLNTIYGEHDISYERSYQALKWLKEVSISFKNLTSSKK